MEWKNTTCEINIRISLGDVINFGVKYIEFSCVETRIEY